MPEEDHHAAEFHETQDPKPLPSKGFKALYLAAEAGHTDVVKLLLERVQDPLERSGETHHPLQRSVQIRA